MIDDGEELMPARLLDPVEGVLGVLDEGAATGTNKFALLLALIDLAPSVEGGVLSVDHVAEKLLEIHWEHGRAYNEQVLRQLTSGNRDNTTAVLEVQRLQEILRQAGHGQLSFEVARDLIPGQEWEQSVGTVAKATKKNPLRYLQRINRQEVAFLYEPVSGDEIRFLPGAIDALVRFGPVLRDLVEFRYVRFVVLANRLTLGVSQEEQVAEHLFGMVRHMPSPEMRRELWQLQQGKCLYTGSEVPDPADGGGWSVDHVVAWSRVRLSALENLVLTTPSVNSRKSIHLLAPALVGRWTSFLMDRRDDLREIGDRYAWPTDVGRVAGVASAVYRHATEGAAVWAGGNGVTAMGEDGRQEILSKLAELEVQYG